MQMEASGQIATKRKGAVWIEVSNRQEFFYAEVRKRGEV
jgi:hypothetical protein